MPPTHSTHPPRIYGLRRPHREVLVSAYAPTSGWTRRPESGPARKTRATCDVVRPRERRYGEAYDISTDQKIWTPRRPMVSVGRCAQRGPTTRAVPDQRASAGAADSEGPNPPDRQEARDLLSEPTLMGTCWLSTFHIRSLEPRSHTQHDTFARIVCAVH
jgi:hypothetical protein